MSDENTCRLDMKPGEAAALGTDLEKLEKREAEKRHREGSRRGGKGGAREGGENFTQPSKDKTRDVVAKAVGLSGPTFKRAQKVIEVAEDTTQPAHVLAVASVVVAPALEQTGPS